MSCVQGCQGLLGVKVWMCLKHVRLPLTKWTLKNSDSDELSNEVTSGLSALPLPCRGIAWGRLHAVMADLQPTLHSDAVSYIADMEGAINTDGGVSWGVG